MESAGHSSSSLYFSEKPPPQEGSAEAETHDHLGAFLVASKISGRLGSLGTHPGRCVGIWKHGMIAIRLIAMNFSVSQELLFIYKFTECKWFWKIDGQFIWRRQIRFHHETDTWSWKSLFFRKFTSGTSLPMRRCACPLMRHSHLFVTCPFWCMFSTFLFGYGPHKKSASESCIYFDSDLYVRHGR